jgi:beta-lactamase superfamily II metal-dependent hydrolase
MDEPDRAKPNGTSIAFVLQYNGERTLFLADGHPDAMASALQRYRPQEKLIDFAAIKVAHHGSAANNTSQLVKKLQSRRWFISSDGSRHQHPDPEAVARLVLAPLRDKTLFFNYRTEFNEVWSRSDIEHHYGYTTNYSEAPIAVDLQ